MGEDEARLAVASRGDEADADAVGRAASEQVELGRAVDEELRGDGALEGERRALAGWSHDEGPDGTTNQYQSVERCQPVADAAHGLQRDGAIAELAAQPADHDLDDVRAPAGPLVAPHLTQELLAGHGDALAALQVAQDVELEAAEIDGVTVEDELAVLGVEDVVSACSSRPTTSPSQASIEPGPKSLSRNDSTPTSRRTKPSGARTVERRVGLRGRDVQPPQMRGRSSRYARFVSSHSVAIAWRSARVRPPVDAGCAARAARARGVGAPRRPARRGRRAATRRDVLRQAQARVAAYRAVGVPHDAERLRRLTPPRLEERVRSRARGSPRRRRCAPARSPASSEPLGKNADRTIGFSTR